MIHRSSKYSNPDPEKKFRRKLEVNPHLVEQADLRDLTVPVNSGRDRPGDTRSEVNRRLLFADEMGYTDRRAKAGDINTHVDYNRSYDRSYSPPNSNYDHERREHNRYTSRDRNDDMRDAHQDFDDRGRKIWSSRPPLTFTPNNKAGSGQIGDGRPERDDFDRRERRYANLSRNRSREEDRDRKGPSNYTSGYEEGMNYDEPKEYFG